MKVDNDKTMRSFFEAPKRRRAAVGVRLETGFNHESKGEVAP